MKKTIFFLTLAILFSVIVYIYINNQIASENGELGLLEKYLREQQVQNLLLREELLQEMSYTNIATKAASLGFVPNPTIIYLK